MSKLPRLVILIAATFLLVQMGAHSQKPEPAIDIEKLTNGFQADLATDPMAQILPGDPVVWEYIVTNTGPVKLENVTVTDSQGVTVTCPKDVLNPLESMTCNGPVGAVALDLTTIPTVPGECAGEPGQVYENIGTVTGTTIFLPDPIMDTDPSHYCNPPGRIIVRKVTNPPGGTGFAFTDNIAAPNSFNLNHGQSKTFFPVTPGLYQATEQDPSPDFELTNLVCNDPSGGTTRNLGARRANIDVTFGETVVCTFTNEPPVNGPLLAHWRLLLLGVLLAMAATFGVRIRRHG